VEGGNGIKISMKWRKISGSNEISMKYGVSAANIAAGARKNGIARSASA